MGSEQLQRYFWHSVYDKLSLLYDGVDWFTGNATHRLRLRVWPYLPPAGSRVLEIGFGSGRLHLQLAESFVMSGLDLAAGMVRLTRRRLAARDLASTLCCASACALPWPDGYFDAVIATFALSAIPDAERAMDEMVRVIGSSGKVILVDAGEAADGNAMVHFLARLWEQLGDYIRDEAPLMESRGLRVVRKEYGPWGCVHIVVGTKST
ncbi:MAG: class I SAM-dependent methyltransferase [Anaerolineae bacterium]|nr:class I SAM-dependent methyltransferase [Anaerolineae bacterium]